MQVDDLRALRHDHAIEADVFLIGAGPAGLTLAREFAGSAFRVVILESGGLVRQPESDALNEIDSVGMRRVLDQWTTRNRLFGGSSHTWSGRCAPLDEIDFARRSWVPYSGWPIDRRELLPFYERAATHLGLAPNAHFRDAQLHGVIGHRRLKPEFDSDLLRPFFWQISKDTRHPIDFMRFGPNALTLAALNLRAIVNATVTHINTDPSGSRVESIEISTPEGARRIVRARHIVLCGGGIENARLLLTSNRIIEAGVGNRHDVVGRFLMDHLRGAIGRFEPQASRRVDRRFANYLLPAAHGVNSLVQGLALTPSVQKDEGLLNCALMIHRVHAADDPWDALRRVRHRNGNLAADLAALTSNLGMLADGLWQRWVALRGMPHKLERVELLCIVEQQPNPQSRIMLSERTDPLGVPLAKIDWRISEREQRTVWRIGELAVQEFKRLGLSAPVLEEWAQTGSRLPLCMPDVAHPTGSTRMSIDPTLGVVDVNCQVHGVEGLYVAGSSVFPTGGHANPTETIIALTVRLADRLKRRLGSSQAFKVIPQRAPEDVAAVVASSA